MVTNNKFLKKIDAWDTRPVALIEQHYKIEKALASRLRSADKDSRKQLYTLLYDELYMKVPEIAELLSIETKREYTERQLRWLKNFLKPHTVFVEIGPGSCGVCMAVNDLVNKVYAVDVTDKYFNSLSDKKSIMFTKFDGTTLPIDDNSVDIVYCDQVIEHLHPEDAYLQLLSVFKVLKNKGVYICKTPNRLSGPHDVSKYFDDVATGFHLKEYTFIDLVALFKKVGFSKFRYYPNIRKSTFGLPTFIVIFFERILLLSPRFLKERLVSNYYISRILDISIAAFK